MTAQPPGSAKTSEKRVAVAASKDSTRRLAFTAARQSDD
jgi:hypothetical protein